MSESIETVNNVRREYIYGDIEWVHPIFDKDSCKGVQMDGAETRLLFRFNKDTNIYSPIAGKLNRVYLYTENNVYAYEIKSDTTTCLMSPISELVVPEKALLKAGELIGKIIIPDGMRIWHFYVTIVSHHEWLNILYTLFR